MYFDEIGTVIRETRKKRKMSQQKLADFYGMSRATISGIENGTIGDLGIRKILAICDVLGLELIVREKQGRPTLQQLLAENEQERLANLGISRRYKDERFTEKELSELKLLFADLRLIAERMENDEGYRKKVTRLLS